MERNGGLRALFALLTPLALLSAGCGTLDAIDISTIPGMWTVIALLLSAIGIGASIYLVLWLLQMDLHRR